MYCKTAVIKISNRDKMKEIW